MKRLLPLALVAPLLVGCSESDSDAPEPLPPADRAPAPEPSPAEPRAADDPRSADAEDLYAPPPAGAQVVCECELGSWIVAMRGRHLYLDIDCPDGFDHLDGRIEYTSAALRHDFDPTLLPQGELPRLVRMTPGGRLWSPVREPRPRTEMAFEVDVATAAWLQRDVAFTTPYILTGSNSNAAMRAVLDQAGIELPEAIVTSTGFLGEFPGIDQPVGEEIPYDRWARFGLPEGPRAPEGELPAGWEALGAVIDPVPETPAP